MSEKEEVIDDLGWIDDPLTETQLEKLIKAWDSAKVRDKLQDITEANREMQFEERYNKENPVKKNWEYFSKPHEGDLEFYKEKAKFIFKNQLKNRDFLLEYKNSGKNKEVEKMSFEEFRSIKEDILFLDSVDYKLRDWYEYMFMLYTCGISYKKLEPFFGKNKGSIENEVKKGINAFAELLMERDINILMGKELAEKAMQFLKIELEDDPKRYLEFIGKLADKMMEMYDELRKKNK